MLAIIHSYVSFGHDFSSWTPICVDNIWIGYLDIFESDVSIMVVFLDIMVRHTTMAFKCMPFPL